jgi:hypothetical protein
MPLKITAPIEKEFHLEETDKTYGVEGQTRVTIRQATQRAHERRENLYSEILKKYSSEHPGEVTLIQNFSVSEIQRVEAFLTIVNSNIETEKEGELLFTSDVLKSEKKFQEAWGTLPIDVAEEIMQCVYKVNISWNPLL